MRRESFEGLQNVSLDELLQVRAVWVIELYPEQWQIGSRLSTRPHANHDWHANFRLCFGGVEPVLALVFRTHFHRKPPEFGIEEIGWRDRVILSVMPAKILAEIDA